MRKNSIRCATLAATCLVLSMFAMAETTDAPQTAKSPKSDDVRVQLSKKFPGSTPEDVRLTPIPGVYELSLGGKSAFITADGKYSIYEGDLYEMSSKTNLSEAHRSQRRMVALANIREADTIIFAPKSTPKHTVTVFIDVDCGYCRKLHSEIDELNKLGVRVRYTAYPRSGPGSSSWEKMETVWCSKDRRDALTKAQLDQDIGTAKCGITPVGSQYKLGEELGVNGTPAIFTENGDYIGGYLPPQKLVQYLNGLKAESTAKKSGS